MVAAAGTTTPLFLIAPVKLTIPEVPAGLVTVAMRELANVGFINFLMGLRTLSADKRFRVMMLFVKNSAAIALLVRCVVIVGSTIRFKLNF